MKQWQKYSRRTSWWIQLLVWDKGWSGRNTVLCATSTTDIAASRRCKHVLLQLEIRNGCVLLEVSYLNTRGNYAFPKMILWTCNVPYRFTDFFPLSPYLLGTCASCVHINEISLHIVFVVAFIGFIVVCIPGALDVSVPAVHASEVKWNVTYSSWHWHFAPYGDLCCAVITKSSVQKE